MPPSKGSSRSTEISSSATITTKAPRRRKAFGPDDDHDDGLQNSAAKLDDAKVPTKIHQSRAGISTAVSPAPSPRRRSSSLRRRTQADEAEVAELAENVKPVRLASFSNVGLLTKTRSGRLVKPRAVFSEVEGYDNGNQAEGETYIKPMLDNPLGGLELHHTHHRQLGQKGAGGGGGGSEEEGDVASGPMDWHERWNMALLVILYMMQGIPLGLTTGAM